MNTAFLSLAVVAVVLSAVRTYIAWKTWNALREGGPDRRS